MAFISPSAGAAGTLVSVSGLKLSALASDDTVFVLVNGLKVPFFLSPFLLSSSRISREFSRELDLLSSPTIILRIPSFQPAKVIIDVIEKPRIKKKRGKRKDEKYQEKFKQLSSFLFTITSASATLTITNLSPNLNIVGTAGIVATLTGTGFVQGVTITIGGIVVTATFISSTEITFLVPSTLAIGTYPITVTNPPSNGSAGSGSSVTSSPPNVLTVIPLAPTCNPMSTLLRQFAILGGTAVTNSDIPLPTLITALSGGNDIGVFPGTIVTGVTAGITNPGGVVHVADAIAETAHNQATMLYNTLAALTPPTATDPTLNGNTLSPGVYNFTNNASLDDGKLLVLNGGGDPAAQFVFQIPGSLTVGTSSFVLLVGETQSCNVFWQVGGTVTIGNNTPFSGSIVASSSITVNSATTIHGRLFSLNSSVSLTSDTISIDLCTTCP